jgi:hypothetical protein
VLVVQVEVVEQLIKIPLLLVQVEQVILLLLVPLKELQVVMDFHFKVTLMQVVVAVVLQQQVLAVGLLQTVVLVVLVEHLQLTQHPQLEVVVEVEQEDNH